MKQERRSIPNWMQERAIRNARKPGRFRDLDRRDTVGRWEIALGEAEGLIGAAGTYGFYDSKPVLSVLAFALVLVGVGTTYRGMKTIPKAEEYRKAATETLR